MWLTDLDVVARRTGYPVVEVPGWRTRGHGEMTGVAGVTMHHTANGGAQGSAPSLAVVRDGRPNLSGPLAQYVIGRSGIIYVVAAGLCYHAGTSISDKFGNPWRIGIEAEAIGTPGAEGDWPEDQMDSQAKLAAALVQHYDLSVRDVLGHKETCRPEGRKTDPSYDMAAFRRRVSYHLEPDMKLSDTVKYSPSAAGRLAKKEDSVETVLQWPPAVRLARDEIAAVSKKVDELIAAFSAFVAATGLQNKALAADLESVKERLDELT